MEMGACCVCLEGRWEGGGGGVGPRLETGPPLGEVQVEVVFSSMQGNLFCQTKPSLTWGCASGDGMCIWRGDSSIGWVRRGPERHWAVGKRTEGFGVTRTGLESHFGHLAV